MRVPDNFLKSIFFVCGKDGGGQIHFGGTGFLVSIPLKDNPAYEIGYAITAKHVIEHGSNYPEMFLRFNDVNGKEVLLNCKHFDWVFPDDPSVDVAIAECNPNRDKIDFRVIQINMFATQEIIEREGIGVGNDIYIIGLFSERHGVRNNRPIVRYGHLAAMANELMTDNNTGFEYNAFLGDILSIGGLSGSPVFVELEPVSADYKKRAITFERKGFLLGLVRGHWDRKQKNENSLIEEFENVNIGVTIITPISEVLSVLFSERFSKNRNKVDRETTKEKLDKTPDQ